MLGGQEKNILWIIMIIKQPKGERSLAKLIRYTVLFNLLENIMIPLNGPIVQIGNQDRAKLSYPLRAIQLFRGKITFQPGSLAQAGVAGCGRLQGAGGEGAPSEAEHGGCSTGSWAFPTNVWTSIYRPAQRPWSLVLSMGSSLDHHRWNMDSINEKRLP